MDGIMKPLEPCEAQKDGMSTPTQRKQFSLYPTSISPRSVLSKSTPLNDTSTPDASSSSKVEASTTRSQLSTKDSYSGSLRSCTSSNVMEDAKHEVMAKYLSHQQRSKEWIKDTSGEREGIILRKSRNSYVAYPPELVHSPLLSHCASLNIAVSNVGALYYDNLTIFPGRSDSKLSCHPHIS